MQNFVLESVFRLKRKVEPSFSYLQAESSKKKSSSKEELQFNISELRGTIVKQGFLVKQVNTVFEPSLETRKMTTLRAS